MLCCVGSHVLLQLFPCMCCGRYVFAGKRGAERRRRRCDYGRNGSGDKFAPACGDYLAQGVAHLLRPFRGYLALGLYVLLLLLGLGRDEHIEHPLRKAHPADEHERETAEDEEDYAEHAEETADQQQPYGNKAEREHEQRLDHRPEQERKAALEKQRGPRLVAYADGDEPHAYDADEHAQYYHEHGCGYRPASRSAAGYREIIPGADEHRAEEHEHEHRNGHGHPEIALAHAVKIALYGEVALRVDQPAQRIARARNAHRGYQRTKHDHRIEYNVGLHAELFEHAERTRIGGQRGGADVGSKGIYRDERTDVDLTQVCSRGERHEEQQREQIHHYDFAEI